ncbi:hypothetical protein [Marinicrinis lubricantis]|uniref:HAD family hydrolase n=1 Tax=Marinicrinis lubricantis TaxID=2086470 RepID=A0ABW1IPE4_9BACL
MVKQFHRVFRSPYAERPQLLDRGTISEKDESMLQSLEQFVKEMKVSSIEGNGGRMLARTSWMLEELCEFTRAETIEDQADALIDLIYFAMGTFVEMGVRPEKLFEIVNEANMSKLWPDGEPHFNEQGKIVKPEGWQPPEEKLAEEIRRQLKEQAPV